VGQQYWGTLRQKSPKILATRFNIAKQAISTQEVSTERKTEEAENSDGQTGGFLASALPYTDSAQYREDLSSPRSRS